MYKYLGDMKLYDIFVMLGFFSVMIFNLSHLRKKKQFPGKLSAEIINRSSNSDKKIPVASIMALIEILIITEVQYALGGMYNETLANLTETVANYYGMMYFGPLALALVCLLLGTDLIKVFDLITPSYALGLIFAKTACFCSGCCNGIEFANGLYNQTTNAVEFPVQLLEAGNAFLIFVFLMLWRKKAKKGTMFPTYLMLYSATRFFTEFFRAEPDILGSLKKYHILCIAGFLIGLIEFIIALKFSHRISDIFTKSNKSDIIYAAAIDKICSTFKSLFIKEDKDIVHHKKRKKKNQKKSHR